MITARRKSNGSFEITNGHMRLKAQLEGHGEAEVHDLSTGQTYRVHDVGGRVVALSNEAQANVEDMANAAINRARS